MSRRLKKLALGTAVCTGLSFGLWTAADACLPQPDIAPAFNAAAQAGIHEYKLKDLQLPENMAEIWRVRLGSWEMAAGGHHTFLEFGPYCDVSKSCASKGEIFQIHGIAMDGARHDYAVLDFWRTDAYTRYFNGDYQLKAFGVNHDHNRKVFGMEPQNYLDVFYGSKDDVLKIYLDGMKLVEEVNRRSDLYELLDHNSNSVQRTLLEGMGVGKTPLYEGHRLTAIAGRVWTPGMQLSLLPRDWSRDRAREEGGYGRLSGDALEQLCKQASGVNAVWKEFKPAPAPVPQKGPGP